LCHLGDLGSRFVQRFLAFFVDRQIEKKTRLLKTGAVLLPSVDDIFERGLFFQDSLSLFAVIPEIWLGRDSIQLLDPLAFFIEVKDASAAVRVALPGGSIVLWFLPTSYYLVLAIHPLGTMAA
jgi:hypothetical protein